MVTANSGSLQERADLFLPTLWNVIRFGGKFLIIFRNTKEEALSLALAVLCIWRALAELASLMGRSDFLLDYERSCALY